MAIISKMVVSLQTDHAKFSRGMDKAKNKLQRFGKATSNAARLLTGFLGVAAGASLGIMIKSAITAGDEIHKMSQRIGASTEALSQYRHVAEQSGVAFNTLTMGWQRMVRRISEAAAGFGEAKGALKELNLSATELNQLRPEEQFEILADALMGVENQADRVRLAMKLFDSEGVSLLQTMQGGSKAIRAMREELDAMGGTLTQEGANKLAEAANAMGRLKNAATALSQTLAVELGPALEAIANWLAKHLPTATEFAIEGFKALRWSILSMLESNWRFLASISDLAGKLPGLGGISKELSETLRGMAESAELNNKAMVLAKGTVPEFTSSLKSVGGAAEEATTKVNGLTDAEKELQQLMSDGQTVFDATRSPMEQLNIEYERLNRLLEVGAINFDTYSRAIFNAQDQFEDLAETTKESTEKMSEFALEAQRRIQNALGDQLFNLMQGNFDNIGDQFKSLLDRMVADALAAEIGQAIFKEGGFFNKAIGWLFEDVPGKAIGGPVSANSPYVVGEKGPELFVPNASGQIVPNDQLGGGMTVVNNFTVQAPDGHIARESEHQIAARVGATVDMAMRRG